MKIRVLIDNNTLINEYYLGEPGVSYYIEDEEEKILFDTGYSDAFIKNAQKLNIDLGLIDKIVISHGHNDHTGGLKYFFENFKNDNIELVAHPGCFEEKYGEKGYIGAPVNDKDLNSMCRLNLTNKPLKISNNIMFLGEIPQINSFEKRKKIGEHIIHGNKEDDFVNEDSAIVYKSKDGLFVITGCSHSGICNIIEYAKKVCNEEKIAGVIGGFHLFDHDERLENTVDYFKENSIKNLYPCHCVSLKAKIEIAKRLEIQEVGCGMEIEII